MASVLASSETQGRSVGPGEKARRKFSSTGGKAPGYRLSPDHFQTVKRMLAPDWAQKMLCIIVPNRWTVSPEFIGSRGPPAWWPYNQRTIIITINNWPMKFVEVCVLGNPRMTISKGYSGVFELNISVYFAWGVHAPWISQDSRESWSRTRLEHLRIFSISRSAHLQIRPLGMSWYDRPVMFNLYLSLRAPCTRCDS